MIATSTHKPLSSRPQALSAAFRVRIALLIFVYFELGYQVKPIFAAMETIDATTAIDVYFPKIPFFIVFYTIGYILPFIPCFLVKARDDFMAGTLGYFVILTTSFMLFRAIPIELTKDLADGLGFFSSWMLLQQTIDTNLNNFPSLHVSLNVFALLMLKHHHRQAYLLCLPLVIGVVLSTLAVKQHFFVDVVGGICLAVAIYTLHPYMKRLGALFATPYFSYGAVRAQKSHD